MNLNVKPLPIFSSNLALIPTQVSLPNLGMSHNVLRIPEGWLILYNFHIVVKSVLCVATLYYLLIPRTSDTPPAQMNVPKIEYFKVEPVRVLFLSG
jgi:hypothetical protein